VPSTIEKIKVGHDRLAKTTLEKLAAFRFTKSSTKMPVQHDHSQNSVVQKETLDSFIRDNNEQLGDDCVASVPHDVNGEIQTTLDNKSHEQTADVPFPRTAFEGPGEVFNDLFDDLGLDYANSRDTTLLERSDHLCVEMQKESAMQGFSKDRHGNVAISKSFIPSTEAQPEQDVTDDHPQSSHHWEEGLADEDLLQLDVENITLIHSVTVLENTTNTTPSPGPREEYDDEYDQGLADEDFVEIRDTEQDDSNNILGNQTIASFGTRGQDTRVDNALPALLSSRSLEGFDDEYNGGVADEDFMEIIDTKQDDSNNGDLRNQTTAPFSRSLEDFDDEFDDGGVADEDFMEIMDTEQDGSNNDVLRNQTTVPLGTTGQDTGIKDTLPISSRNLEDFDDEYSMDEEDEAALANLLETDPIVVESHSPPSSVVPSEADSRDREIYDEKLGHSPISPISDRSIQPSSAWGVENIINNTQMDHKSSVESLTETEDWSFLKWHQPPQTIQNTNHECLPTAPLSLSQPSRLRSIADDAHEYLPLAPFARPPFPARVRDRSPVPGITSSSVLRTCFRIGEALRAGSLCSRTNQDAVIELFCRVTFSSREDGCHRQHFQFGDLFHANPPFVNGVVENYMASGALGEVESRALVTVGTERREGDMGEMVRVLGRLKRVIKGAGWVLEVVNVRKTDWEEVRWTKRIAGAGEVKQEVEYDFETLARRGMVRD